MGSVSAIDSDNAPFKMSWNDKGAHERPVRLRYATLVKGSAARIRGCGKAWIDADAHAEMGICDGG